MSSVQRWLGPVLDECDREQPGKQRLVFKHLGQRPLGELETREKLNCKLGVTGDKREEHAPIEARVRRHVEMASLARAKEEAAGRAGA